MCCVLVIYFIKYKSVRISPESPLYDDEIETEGLDNFKIIKQ